jgi:hypothetical protein
MASRQQAAKPTPNKEKNRDTRGFFPQPAQA